MTPGEYVYLDIINVNQLISHWLSEVICPLREFIPTTDAAELKSEEQNTYLAYRACLDGIYRNTDYLDT